MTFLLNTLLQMEEGEKEISSWRWIYDWIKNGEQKRKTKVEAHDLKRDEYEEFLRLA